MSKNTEQSTEQSTEQNEPTNEKTITYGAKCSISFDENGLPCVSIESQTAPYGQIVSDTYQIAVDMYNSSQAPDDALIGEDDDIDLEDQSEEVSEDEDDLF